MMALNTDECSNNQGGKETRINWMPAMLTNLFDIIMDSDLLKRALLLENIGQVTKQYYISIATVLQSRMKNYKETVNIFQSAKQCNCKVKNVKAEIKMISLLKDSIEH